MTGCWFSGVAVLCYAVWGVVVGGFGSNLRVSSVWVFVVVGFVMVVLLLFGLTSYVLSVWVRILWNFLVWGMLVAVLVVAGGFVVVWGLAVFWVFWLFGSCSFCDLRCVLVWVLLGCLLTVCLQVGFC